ncbi:MAG: hypothetical protein ACM31K_03190, partial [Solirubrobacterales bacterium]
RLVVADAKDRVRQMADRHAGRLRSELAERSASAVREYQEDLGATVVAAQESIRSAIERARRERHRGQARTAARLEELSSLSDRLRTLSAELRHSSPANS